MEENSRTARIVFWAARGMSILFVVFISVFALDVFSEEYAFWETILALILHLVPTFVLIVILLIAWKWEVIGGAIFILMGFGYFFMAGFHRPISWYVLISGPLFLTGVLFLLSRFFVRKSRL